MIKGSDRLGVLDLVEYEPQRFASNLIPSDIGELLWRQYGKMISVGFPSPVTDNNWELNSLGWVGHINLSHNFSIAIHPKVVIGNIFKMLEYAYRLKSFRFYEGLVDCKSLEEFYQYLAKVLASRILDRARKGFYREYIHQKDVLPFIKGRLNIKKAIQRPWDTKLECSFEEHTADIEDNQILSWALYRIANSGVCNTDILTTVRRAFHTLKGTITLRQINSKACIDRLYNRLNDDYRTLHALCRFFLEQTGPGHESGNKKMMPFLVNMANLFELFVAEWLKKNLPKALDIKPQEKVDVGEGQTLTFKIDLTLYDVESGKALCVLDTKYKAPKHAENEDVTQVLAYAEMKDCKKAFLVYPTMLPKNLNATFRDISVRNLTFSLKGDLEEQGQDFLTALLMAIDKDELLA